MAKPKKTPGKAPDKTSGKAPDPTPEITIGKRYSPKELADILGVTVQILTYLRMTGRGPKYVKFGRRNVIYSAVEVNRYLKEQERLSTSDDGTRYTRLAPYGT